VTCRYFATYLQRSRPGSPVDISVHCDCVIFELLLTFLEGPEVVMRAMIRDMSVAMPILISSNFLKVLTCTGFSIEPCQYISAVATVSAVL
jgi:hypothetical protein